MEKRKIVFHLNCLEHGGAERVVSESGQSVWTGRI